MSNIFGFIPEAGLLAIKNGVAGGDGYVTINTTQTITGQKTFDTNTYFNANLYTQNLIASNNIQGAAVTAGHIYPTNSIVFPDGSSQFTAYKSLTPGTYSTCTITVDANGAISTITSGSANSANVVLCVSPAPLDVYSLCFAAQGTNGYKQIYQDYSVLTYDYANSKLTSNQLQSTSLTTTNFACSYVNSVLYNPSSSVPLTLSSGAGQGVNVTVNNGTNAFLFGSGNNTSYVPLNCYSPASGAAALGLALSGGGDQIQFYPTITNSSDWNPLTLAGQTAIVGRSASSASTQSLVLTVWAAMAAGIQINPTSVLTQSGDSKITLNGTMNTIQLSCTQSASVRVNSVTDTFTFGTLSNTSYLPLNTESVDSPSSSLTLSADLGMTLAASTCPVMLGYTVPLATDSSNKIATTAWVQSALGTVPTVATTINMTDNTSSTSTFALCYGTTSPDGSKPVYQDYTGLTYKPSTNALTVGLINEVSFKLDAASNLYAGLTSTFPFFGQGGGYQNVTYGSGAGQYCTTGYYNVYVGYRAGYSDPYSSGPATGHANVCVGTNSGYSLMDGSDNILIGYNAGYHLNGQIKNICIGSAAGSSTTLVGNNNVLIGFNVQPTLTLEDNAVVLGGPASVNYYFGSNASTYNMPGNISGGNATLNQITMGGMLKQSMLTLDYTTTTFPYTLPSVLPTYVFIKANTTATKTISFPVPAAQYSGVKITFRKTPNPGNYYGDINFTISGGGNYFCEYNTVIATSSQSFSSGSVFIEFICDGFYWYANSVV